MQSFVLWILVVAIGIPVVVGVLGGIARHWIAMKERQLDRAAELAAEKAAAQAAHIDRLETRVRVLERIATDKGADVAAQIDALRGERLN
jgi:hypothetical protein